MEAIDSFLLCVYEVLLKWGMVFGPTKNVGGIRQTISYKFITLQFEYLYILLEGKISLNKLPNA